MYPSAAYLRYNKNGWATINLGPTQVLIGFWSDMKSRGFRVGVDHLGVHKNAHILGIL